MTLKSSLLRFDMYLVSKQNLKYMIWKKNICTVVVVKENHRHVKSQLTKTEKFVQPSKKISEVFKDVLKVFLTLYKFVQPSKKISEFFKDVLNTFLVLYKFVQPSKKISEVFKDVLNILLVLYKCVLMVQIVLMSFPAVPCTPGDRDLQGNSENVFQTFVNIN